jgi:hypothetical protein
MSCNLKGPQSVFPRLDTTSEQMRKQARIIKFGDVIITLSPISGDIIQIQASALLFRVGNWPAASQLGRNFCCHGIIQSSLDIYTHATVLVTEIPFEASDESWHKLFSVVVPPTSRTQEDKQDE